MKRAREVTQQKGGATAYDHRIYWAVGTRSIRRVIDGPTVPLPVQWDNFINMTESKANLTMFLTNHLKTCAAALGETIRNV